MYGLGVAVDSAVKQLLTCQANVIHSHMQCSTWQRN